MGVQAAQLGVRPCGGTGILGAPTQQGGIFAITAGRVGHADDGEELVRGDRALALAVAAPTDGRAIRQETATMGSAGAHSGEHAVRGRTFACRVRAPAGDRAIRKQSAHVLKPCAEGDKLPVGRLEAGKGSGIGLVAIGRDNIGGSRIPCCPAIGLGRAVIRSGVAARPGTSPQGQGQHADKGWASVGVLTPPWGRKSNGHGLRRPRASRARPMTNMTRACAGARDSVPMLQPPLLA